MLSTTYISHEVEFLISQPLEHEDVFNIKLFESMLYSSWAFGILSFPLFISYGMTREVSWLFYPMSLLLILPYLVIPAGLGSTLTMFIAAYFPARRTRALSVVLGGLSIGLMVFFARIMGMGRLMATTKSDDFLEIMGILNVGSIPILPNFWLAQGLSAIAPADKSGALQVGTYFYWLSMLMSTALFFLVVCQWLAPRLYYRGWCLSKESASTTELEVGKFSILAWLDRLLEYLPAQLRALVSKDSKTFWRDPAQWTQLIILFGLLVIYVGNLRSASGYSKTFEVLISKWRSMISFFNLGATCFILSILTTRFVYPLLSLEGKQFWIIGLAPMRRSKIVWEKFWLCFVSSFFIAEFIMILSNYVLEVSGIMRWMSVVTVLIMAFGLTSLSVGLGALTPNFKEDNPARIANGLGGTLNVILSLIYIGGTIAMLIIPVYIHAVGAEKWILLWDKWVIPYVIVVVLFQVVTIVAPMWFGIRRWNNMEF